MKALLGMQDCKPAPTPAVKSKKETDEHKEFLDDEQSSTYRSAVGILLYISHGRSDAQWAIGDLAKDIKHPTEGSMKRLKRCVRYLSATDRKATWIDARGDLAGS